ncbi:MAG: hypothetical protein WCA21_14385 [Terracidiphilus sp.]
MEVHEITREEFDEFRRLQIRRDWIWPAKFSTNIYGELWPWVTNGKTPIELRKDVRGLSPLLDEVGRLYRMSRNEGGRIFINYEGAFWRSEDDDRPVNPILRWTFADDVRPVKKQRTYSDFRSQIEARGRR